jgi:hypothetical protein
MSVSARDSPPFDLAGPGAAGKIGLNTWSAVIRAFTSRP